MRFSPFLSFSLLLKVLLLATFLLHWGTLAFAQEDEILSTITSRRLWVGGGTVTCTFSDCDSFTSPHAEIATNILKAGEIDGQIAESECSVALIKKYQNLKKPLPSKANVRLIKKNDEGKIIEEDRCAFSGLKRQKPKRIFSDKPLFSCIQYRNLKLDMNGIQVVQNSSPILGTRNGESTDEANIPYKLSSKSRIEICSLENAKGIGDILITYGLSEDLRNNKADINLLIEDMDFIFKLKSDDNNISNDELIGETLKEEVLNLGYGLNSDTTLSSRFSAHVVGRVSLSLLHTKNKTEFKIKSLSLCPDTAPDECKFSIGQKLDFTGISNPDRNSLNGSLASGPVERTIERLEEYSGTMNTETSDSGVRFKWAPTLQVSKMNSDMWESFLQYNLTSPLDSLLQNYMPLQSINSFWKNSGWIKSRSVITPFSDPSKRGSIEITGEQTALGEVNATFIGGEQYASRQAINLSNFKIAKNSNGAEERDGHYRYERTLRSETPDVFTGRILRKEDFSCNSCFHPAACPWCGASDLSEFFYATSLNGGPPLGAMRIFGGGEYPNRGFDPLGYYSPTIFSRPELGFNGSTKALSESALPGREVTDLFGVAPIDIRAELGAPFDTFVAKSPKVRVLPKDLVFINGLPEKEIKPGEAFHKSIQKYEDLLSAFEKEGVRVKRVRVLTGNSLREAFRKIPEGAVVIIFIHGHKLGFGVNHNPNEKNTNASQFVSVAELSQISKSKKLSVIFEQSCFGGWHRSLAEEVIGSIGVSFENTLGDHMDATFGLGGALYHHSVDDLVNRIKREFSLGTCIKPRK